MEGLIGSPTARMFRSNFCTAVELDMLTRMLASEIRLEKGAYDKLRVKSIHNVKSNYFVI
ncbi:MAG TPA: hypothetical protein VHO71_02275 [Caproiciproducens sp.]|nr:hypothetical protein [Caproiciproducens sp.]